MSLPSKKRHIENAYFSLVCDIAKLRKQQKFVQPLFVILRRNISTKMTKDQTKGNPLRKMSCFLKIFSYVAVKILTFPYIKVKR